MRSQTIRHWRSGFFVAALAFVSMAAADPVDDGVAWLSGQQTASGNWGGESGSPATLVQSTAEVLETFALTGTQPAYGQGLAWMSALVPANSDDAARRLHALAVGGVDFGDAATALASARNADGGWGLDTGLASDLLDTALAVRALARAGAGGTALTGGRDYLLNNRNGDGGVGLLAGEESTVYDTALHLLALREVQLATGSAASNLTQAIAASCAYLIAERNGDGGWGAGGSTVFETGLAAYGLARAACSFDSTPTVNYLASTQQVAGSWNGNAYETALAVRAMLLVGRPNLAISAADIGFSPEQPVQGEAVTIRALVRNLGLQAASAVVVRFFDGPPGAGGIQIGADSVIANLAGGASAEVTASASWTELGSRDIHVQVDPDNAIPEASEVDNLAVATVYVVVPAPDLTLAAGDFVFSPPAPGQGQAFSWNVTVHNIGRLDAANVAVRYFDGDPAAGGAQVGSDQIIALIPAGGSGTAQVQHAVLNAGPVRLYVQVDPADAIAEGREDNNQASAVLTIQPLPDLAISEADIGFVPATPGQGKDFVISTLVRNAGAGAAGPFAVKLYDGDPAGGGVLLVTWNFGGLGAGANQNLNFTWSAPVSGPRAMFVVLDSENQVGEIFENNNRASRVVEIVPLPDLAMAASDITAVPAFPAPGEDFSLRATVRNLGDAPATNVAVRLYNGDPDTGGSLIGSEQIIDDLAAGSSATVTVTANLASEGAYPIHAVVDPADAIPEITEANNRASRTLFLSAVSPFQWAESFIIAVDDNSNLYYAKSNGDGTFANYRRIWHLGGSFSRGVIIEDFNQDGHLDFIAGRGISNTAYYYLFLNDGHDNFTNTGLVGTLSGAGSYAMDMAAGDFNGDGYPDFVANGNSATTGVFLNDGKGGFTSREFNLGGSGRGMDVADFNGDGIPDLVRARASDGLTYLHPGNGDGTFGTAIFVVDPGGDPYGLAAGDFNGDGHADLVINEGGSGDAYFVRGNGDGTFAAPVYQPSLDFNDHGAYDAYDFNQDGRLDIVAVNYTGRRVLFYPGNGDGSFGSATQIGTTVTNTLGISAPPYRRFGAPYAVITPAEQAIPLGGTAALSGAESRDSDDLGSLTAYAWNYGDGTTGSGVSGDHVYGADEATDEGTYNVTLRVTDDQGLTGLGRATVRVQGDAPLVDAGGPYAFGEEVASNGIYTATLDGSASFDAGGIVRYEWDFGDGFADDFADGAAGDGAPVTWTPAAGTWSVDAGAYRQTDSTTTANRTVTLASGNQALSHYSFEADVQIVEGSGQEVQLVFHARDPNNRYELSLRGGSSNDLRFLRFVNNFTSGSQLVDYDLPFAVEAGRVYRLKVEALGSTFRFYLDGSLAFEASDSTHAGGRVGLSTYRTHARFDNVELRSVGEGANPSHLYEPGVYPVSLRVTDKAGQSAVATTTVSVSPGAPPVAVAGPDLTRNGADAVDGTWTVTFDGTASSDDVEVVSYLWDFGDGNTGSGPVVRHNYTPAPGDLPVKTYTVTLTVTDRALQTHSVTRTVTIDLTGDAPPVADAGGDYTVNEDVARDGLWTARVDGSGSSDDIGIARYVWDYGDGHTTTTWNAVDRVRYLASGTRLYGYDTPTATLRVIATQNATRVRVINLETGALVASTTLNRFGVWTGGSPGDGIYFRVESDKPILAYLGNGSGASFVPSLDDGPVGREFIYQHTQGTGFYVFAMEDADVRFFNTSGGLVARTFVAAGSYGSLSLSGNTVYRVVASGRIAMQNTANNAYTVVPSVSGSAVGRLFYGATQAATGNNAGAYLVMAHEDADVSVYDLDSGELLWSQTVTAGSQWFNETAGTRRLRFESTGDIAVWAGGTEGAGVDNLGDDLSTAGGVDEREFYIHGLRDGAVVFALYDDTAVDVNGTVQVLQRDQYLTLAGSALHRVVTSKPVVTQTLGRANAFNDLGTYLGGVAETFHWYSAVGTYNSSLTVYDQAGQSTTDTFVINVLQGEPPEVESGGPYEVGEAEAAGGVWTVRFDASGSTDDYGIQRFEWDFDASNGNTQVNATGPAPTWQYNAPGTYTVTLRVYDQALQVTTVTTTVTVGFGTAPVADSGGPYTFGEAFASYGVWTATLDGSGSTDDSGIFDYVWRFDPELLDDFGEAALAADRWQFANAERREDLAGYEGQGMAVVTGNGSWGPAHVFSRQSWPRETRSFLGRILPANTSGNQYVMWGLKDTGSSTSYTAMPHAIYFNNNAIQIYEQGASRGSVGSYTRGVMYDLRIDVKATAGATYYYRQSGSAEWVRLYDSPNRSETPLVVGATVASGVIGLDEFTTELSLNGPVVTRQFRETGDYGVTLHVRDNALQTASERTTVTIARGDPPVAEAGGPYTAEVGNLVALSGAGSSDDHGVQIYRWDFGNTTGGPGDANLPYKASGAIVRHFYDTPGTYTATLTVTDHVGQTDTATATVNVVVGAPPVARAGGPYLAGVGGPPAYFDGTGSSDDFGVVEYRWDFDHTADRNGDGDPTNDVDGVGPKPFHVYNLATADGVLLADDFSGAALDGSRWLSVGAAQGSGAVTVTGSGSWGARYLFSAETFPRARTRVTGLVRTPTVASQTLMWGLHNGSETNFSYTQMPHALYFNGGNLQIYEDGSSRGTVGSYVRGLAYEVRIDVKAQGVDYFIREAGTDTWTALTGYSSLNRSHSPLRVGATVLSAAFDLDDFQLEGLGHYLATLTVVDGAGQTSSSTAEVRVMANLPPSVVTVPWVVHDPIAPHETYNGKAIRLKGIVRDADPDQYQWDFGDGTQSARLAVTNPHDLSVTHTYPSAPAGTPFVATLSVWDKAGNLGQDTYNVVVKPKNLTTEINVAIDEGLWYLHQTQTRTTTSGFPSGYWTSGATPSATASALQAFQINGHREYSDPRVTPYAETVNRGHKYLMTRLRQVAIGSQPYGEPDTNGNGIGIEVDEGHGPYQLGQVMDAIATTGDPLARAATGRPEVLGRRYFDLLTDMVDMYAWGQYNDASVGGGWRYGWNQHPDNSAAQWGAIGMLPAEDVWHIPVPVWVKERNNRWLDYSYNGTGFGYTGSGNGNATTPGGMVQLTFAGNTPEDPRWRTAERWIADNWDGQYRAGGTNKNYYALYALTKSMRLAKPEAVTAFASNGFDWFDDPERGVARTLIDDQMANGQFQGSQWTTTHLRSAWGVIMLTRSLFVQPPVADAGRDRVWAVDLPFEFDGSGSYHLDPFRSIVRYEWDFDGDGVFDFVSNQPKATHTFTSVLYPEDTLPRTFTARLRVTDNNVPPITDTDTVEIIVAVPPHPPVAVPGGPYTCTQGLPCPLDGSGSFDIDPTDFITRHEWELDGVFPFDFDEASGATPAPVFDRLGTLNIGLRVWDNGVLNENDEPLSDQAFTTVTVVPNLAPLARVDGPHTIDEGQGVTLDAGASSDPNGDPLSFAWDLDGNGEFDDATGALASFTGLDDGVFTVRVRVSDGLLESVAETTVTVDNVAPVVSAGGNTSLPEGGTLGRNGSFTDPGVLDTHQGTVDYGDGSGPQPLDLATDKSFTLAHTYADDGIYTVTVTVTDDDGGVGDTSFTVTVTNVAPSVDAGPDAFMDEGGTFAGSGSFSDPGVLDTHTGTVDYGDGSGVQPLVLAADKSFTLAHTYANDGVYTVAVVVTDDDGGVGGDTLRVTVNNLPPVVDAGPDRTVSIGGTLDLPPATFTDAGVLDTHTAEIVWGDGTAVAGPVTQGAGSGSVAGSHDYTTPGTYTVTVRVTDDGGATGEDSFLVTVLAVPNEPPLADAGGPYTVDEGGTVLLDAAGSSDPDDGPQPLEFAWDLDGDGQYDDAFGPTASFSGVDVGVYPVAVRVYDGADFATAQSTVTVDNLPPVVDAGPDAAIAAGGTFAGSGSFTDPGVQDTHTGTVDWGDGSGVQPLALAADRTFALSHVYPLPGVYTVTVTVTDDDGGVGSDSLVVTVTADNTMPTLQLGPRVTITEGDTFQRTGSFTDPDADTWTAEVNYKDPVRWDPLPLAPDNSFQLEHRYRQDGEYVVAVRVTDSAGARGTGWVRVIVLNAPPVVEAGPDQTVAPGSPVNLAPASFTDAGELDVHTAEIDWGDGTVGPGLVNQGAGNGTVGGNHSYAAPGTYTVTVRVTDDAGASGEDSLTVRVTAAGPEQTVFDLLARAKSGKIDLVWTPVSGAGSYNVYRGTTAGGPYQLIAAGHECSYCAYADFGLTDDVTYYYVVTSVTDGVESLPSNEAHATPTNPRIR